MRLYPVLTSMSRAVYVERMWIKKIAIFWLKWSSWKETFSKNWSTGKIKSSKQIKFSIKGKDFENLLYLFLEKLLILLDSKNFLVSKIIVKINIKDMSLNTLVYGDNSGNYSLNTGIKSVTYNEMFVKKIDGKWVCQVVLDVWFVMVNKR